MLRPFVDDSSPFQIGKEIFLITRSGAVLEAFFITAILGNLVSLDRPPIPGSSKQGFTIERDLLKPNWCEGRRQFYAGCASRQQALELVQKRLSRAEVSRGCVFNSDGR